MTQTIPIDINDEPLKVTLNDFVEIQVWVSKVNVEVDFDYTPPVKATYSDPPHNEEFDIKGFEFANWDIEASMVDEAGRHAVIAQGTESVAAVYSVLKLKVGDKKEDTVEQALKDEIVERFRWEDWLDAEEAA